MSNKLLDKINYPSDLRKFKKSELKTISDELRNELRSNGWSQRESPQVQQTSFLRSDESDGQLGFKFE